MGTSGMLCPEVSGEGRGGRGWGGQASDKASGKVSLSLAYLNLMDRLVEDGTGIRGPKYNNQQCPGLFANLTGKGRKLGEMPKGPY